MAAVAARDEVQLVAGRGLRRRRERGAAGQRDRRGRQAGTRVRVVRRIALEVLAPRLGPGTLIRLEGRNVFVSRPSTSPLPMQAPDVTKREVRGFMDYSR